MLFAKQKSYPELFAKMVNQCIVLVHRNKYMEWDHWVGDKFLLIVFLVYSDDGLAPSFDDWA